MKASCQNTLTSKFRAALSHFSSGALLQFSSTALSHQAFPAHFAVVPRRSPRMLAELMSAVRGQVEVMSPSDLHIVKYIGSGGYGDVYLARWHGTDVAVKSLAVGAADEVRVWCKALPQ